jgi:hypothetical protein
VAPTSVAAFGPVATASTPETTQLAPEEQAAFEQWLRANNIHDLDHPDSHYDYRGAFKAGVGREPGAEGHFPDTFKQHGHETFSNESQYSKGDGGTWQGDTFTPPKSGMRPSAAEPRAKETGPLGPLPDAPPKVNAPYGMKPGVRHVLPGISKLANQKPIDFNQPMHFVMPDGSRIPLVSTAPHDNAIVDNLEKSLLATSANEAERAIARGVAQWGRSLVGHTSIDDIQKLMSERWDHNVGNVVKRDVSHNHILAAGANRANAVPPREKYDNARSDKWREQVEKIIESERKGNKFAALNELDTTFGRMEHLLNEGNPTGERVTQMLELLALSGKQSRGSEQEGITASAGKWDEMANKIALWTNGGKLTDRYVRQFQQYIRSERANILKHRKDIAIQAASGAQDATADFGPDVQKQAGDYVYRRMYEFPVSSRYVPTEDQPQATPPPRATAPRAPAPKAAAPAPAPAPKPAAPAAPKAAAPAPKAPPGAPAKPDLSSLYR